MKPETTHFDPGQLKSFLNAELSNEEQLAVEQHLEQCDECRQQLHNSAAEVRWWEDASDFLNDDEFEMSTAAKDAGTPTAIAARQSTADGADFPTDIRQVVAWLDPTDDPAMLGRLAGYEIAGVVGAGGMGVVLKGFDRSLNRFVAIKILAPHLATSGAARQRFGREAQAAAAVVNDNVVAIHGVDEANGLPYLVMPYLRGISLQRRIDEHGALSVAEVLRLGVQTARGLSAAHDQGLVHRDVKPANILLDGTTDRVLLTDFGLARAADDASLTHSGVIAGTPYFMSPEQAEGALIDHRSDLFSLGSVLYAMCTGRPPFRADTSWGILRKVTDAEPHPIRDLNTEIPIWMCEIIQRLHQKDPNQRFQTADEVAQLLEQCLAHVQQPQECKLPMLLEVQPSRLSVQKRIRPWMLAATVVLLCVAGFAISKWPTVGTSPTENQPSGSAVADGSKAGPEENNAQSSIDEIDETLLDWNDGSSTELSSIRDAVNQLDESSLQIIPERTVENTSEAE